MKKKLLFALMLVMVVTGVVGVITASVRAKSRNALADYKTKLRAQGEKLTFAELGVPGVLESNANFEEFAALADRVAAKSTYPSSLEYRHYEAPGQIVPVWRGGKPWLSGASTNPSAAIDWSALSTDMESAAELLVKLRAELEHPPRNFNWNYTNPFVLATPRNPYVQKRKGVQFLSADTLVALHEHQLPRAQTNLHALTQLAQVHRDDWTLVSAMTRIAISSLAVDCTWHALQADGWDDTSLARLQRDWEALDLIGGLENGFTGERAFGQQSYAQLRAAGEKGRRDIFNAFSTVVVGGSSSSTGFKRVGEQLKLRAAMMYWRGHMDEDELLYLTDSQNRLATIRKLRGNISAASIKVELNAHQAALEKQFDEPLGKYRYLFSAVAIPNFVKAFDVAAQRETEKRLAITAIALKRYTLVQGRYPATLSELTPKFLERELIDPWSGKPFAYRLNATGTFVLYSVGKNGRDNGGDPSPTEPIKAKYDSWQGNDVLWPAAVEANSPVP